MSFCDYSPYSWRLTTPCINVISSRQVCTPVLKEPQLFDEQVKRSIGLCTALFVLQAGLYMQTLTEVFV